MCTRRHFIRRRLAMITAVVGMAISPIAAPAGAASVGGTYVALGDSIASGPLLPNQIALYPCFRSDHNYAHLVATAMHLRLVDVTCSSAALANLTGPQAGLTPSSPVPPQFDALDARTTLVTVTIGANDLGLENIGLSCLNPLPPGIGAPCSEKFRQGNTDVNTKAIEEFGPRFGAALARIHVLAPHARVLVVGYPTFIKQGGCWPLVPLQPADADYLQAEVDLLNQVEAQQAARHDATYVDLATPSAGHDMCEFPFQNWVDGVVPISLSFPTYVVADPVHPTARGMVNFARLIIASLRGAG